MTSCDNLVLASRIPTSIIFIVATSRAHTAAAHAAWISQSSGTTASLRGTATPNSRVAWATGTKGTVLRTVDAGAHWLPSSVPNSEDLDFRDIEAADATHAWLLSSGPGDKSRIYRTQDSGKNWQLQLTNPDPIGFFDAIALFTKRSAILLGDPVDGRFVIYTTTDGVNWIRRAGPESLPGEGAFAASGTCLIARSNGEAWFGTGAARVFHSADSGATWTASQTPLAHQGKAAGVFSLAFHDRLHGIAVGGDYTKPTERAGNVALTDDGGKTWHEPRTRPNGYRSAAAYQSRTEIIATGTSGTDISHDSGQTWQSLTPLGYNALAVHKHHLMAVGPEGRIATGP